MTTELDIVSPKDLRKDIESLKDGMLDERDFVHIMAQSAPWLKDKPQIVDSINKIQDSVDDIERRLHVMESKAN